MKLFHIPQVLLEQLNSDFDVACQKIVNTSHTHPRLRPYQIQANYAVEKAFAERIHKILIAMVPGIGRIFTMENQVFRNNFSSLCFEAFLQPW